MFKTTKNKIDPNIKFKNPQSEKDFLRNIGVLELQSYNISKIFAFLSPGDKFTISGVYKNHNYTTDTFYVQPETVRNFEICFSNDHAIVTQDCTIYKFKPSHIEKPTECLYPTFRFGEYCSPLINVFYIRDFSNSPFSSYDIIYEINKDSYKISTQTDSISLMLKIKLKKHDPFTYFKLQRLNVWLDIYLRKLVFKNSFYQTYMVYGEIMKSLDIPVDLVENIELEFESHVLNISDDNLKFGSNDFEFSFNVLRDSYSLVYPPYVTENMFDSDYIEELNARLYKDKYNESDNQNSNTESCSEDKTSEQNIFDIYDKLLSLHDFLNFKNEDIVNLKIKDNNSILELKDTSTSLRICSNDGTKELSLTLSDDVPSYSFLSHLLYDLLIDDCFIDCDFEKYLKDVLCSLNINEFFMNLFKLKYNDICFLKEVNKSSIAITHISTSFGVITYDILNSSWTLNTNEYTLFGKFSNFDELGFVFDCNPDVLNKFKLYEFISKYILPNSKDYSNFLLQINSTNPIQFNTCSKEQIEELGFTELVESVNKSISNYLDNIIPIKSY